MSHIKNPLVRLVAVDWQDAKGVHQRWAHLEEFLDKPLDHIVYSVGYVIRESKTVLHIAPHIHRDGDGEIQFCGDMEIPKKQIRDLWEIE